MKWQEESTSRTCCATGHAVRPDMLRDRTTGLTESERHDRRIRTIRTLISFCKEQDPSAEEDRLTVVIGL